MKNLNIPTWMPHEHSLISNHIKKDVFEATLSKNHQDTYECWML